jgi:DNA polymerase V
MIALLDCNSFYASCETIFRPDLVGKPVAVLSNNDGCIIAMTKQVKALGVERGAVEFKIRPMLKRNKVHVFSANFALYGNISERINNLLHQFSPEIEPYSIDESFMKLDGITGINYLSHGKKIKHTVEQGTKVPVSIGIAKNKTLAKVANKIAKKGEGVFVIDSDESRIRALKRTKIGDVWGIGRKHSERLRKYGVLTAYDLTQVPEKWVKKQMSVVGLRLAQELKGHRIHDIVLESKPKKSIMYTRSFGKMISDYSELSQAVSEYANRVGEQLRKQNSVARIIRVFIHTNPHRNEPQYYRNRVITLNVSTNSSLVLSQVVNIALRSIYKPNFRYMKAGVIADHITSADGVQDSLFDSIQHEKHKDIMTAFDGINAKYGLDMIKPASCGTQRNHTMRQNMLSFNPNIEYPIIKSKQVI